MARRYIGEATIYITYRDRGDYAGSIVVKGHRWAFEDLHAPACGFPFAYDGPEAYDRMTESAASFGSYYTTHNRGSDLPEWAPAPEVAGAIDAEVSCWCDEQGNYQVRRKK